MQKRETEQTPWIGIQMGAHTMYDEGIEHAMDLLQDTCHLNALVVNAFGGGWRKGSGWIVKDVADHGKPIPDSPYHCPAKWVHTHEAHFRGLRHRWPEEPDTHYGDKDILDECAEPAAQRGIALYPRLFECRSEFANAGDDWDEVDADGRATGKRCVRNPEWNSFSHATVEDLAVNHPYIKGVMYLQERNGPLEDILENSPSPSRIGHCFCDHCCRAAREQGIDPERARQGFRDLTTLALAASTDESPPADGWFISFLRVLTRYPEIFAWQQFWWDGLHRHRQGIYRAIKRIDSNLRVGWHVHNPISFKLFYRAGMDYARISQYSDWVKPNVYPSASGPRSRGTWRRGLLKTLFRDVKPETAIALLFDLFGFDADKMPSPSDYVSGDADFGWDEHYVARETERAVAGFTGVDVYPGLGFDLPAGSASDTPELVAACTRAVFEAGAPGVLLSREYEEMKVEHLRAVGDTLKAMKLV